MLPRNTSDLAKLPEKYAADVSSLSAEAKRETILSQPAGVILFFPGHVMIYYGSDGTITWPAARLPPTAMACSA